MARQTALAFIIAAGLATAPALAEDIEYPDVAPAGGEAADKTQGMALLAVSVTAAGTMQTGIGALSAEQTGTGTYEVTFARDISFSTCAIVPTVTFGSGTASIQNIVDQRRATVATYNAAGSAADHPFSVVVICGQ